MAKPDYMPNDDEGKARLFVRFRDQIGSYLPVLAIAADDPQIAQQAADATRFRALLDFAVTMQSASKASTGEKEHELYGRGGAPANLVLPTPGVGFPAAVPPGIVGRFRKLAQRVKAQTAYNEAMGLALGIEAAQRVKPNLTAVRPVLALELTGGRVWVDWKWQGLREWLDGIELQVDRGAGFEVLTYDSTEGYSDPAPLPATPTVWKYRAIYRVDDASVGQWSQTAQILVGG